jgi:hypothetical protein
MEKTVIFEEENDALVCNGVYLIDQQGIALCSVCGFTKEYHVYGKQYRERVLDLLNTDQFNTNDYINNLIYERFNNDDSIPCEEFFRRIFESEEFNTVFISQLEDYFQHLLNEAEYKPTFCIAELYLTRVIDQIL